MDNETLAAFVDGGLTARERQRVEAHLADCDGCRAALLDVRELLAALSDPVPPDEFCPGRPRRRD